MELVFCPIGRGGGGAQRAGGAVIALWAVLGVVVVRDPGLSRFFSQRRDFFRGPNFKPGCPGIWQAREKNKLGIPAAGLALTQPRRDFFSRTAKFQARRA